jgi:hypothetical protein
MPPACPGDTYAPRYTQRLRAPSSNAPGLPGGYLRSSLQRPRALRWNAPGSPGGYLRSSLHATPSRPFVECPRPARGILTLLATTAPRPPMECPRLARGILTLLATNNAFAPRRRMPPACPGDSYAPRYNGPSRARVMIVGEKRKGPERSPSPWCGSRLSSWMARGKKTASWENSRQDTMSKAHPRSRLRTRPKIVRPLGDELDTWPQDSHRFAGQLPLDWSCLIWPV